MLVILCLVQGAATVDDCHLCPVGTYGIIAGDIMSGLVIVSGNLIQNSFLMQGKRIQRALPFVLLGDTRIGLAKLRLL
jgi:hypothetical protein